MLRAMDSAVAGLRSHQNKLDVIGNNIANVNTLGFKAQSYSFKEAMYQTSTASTGGTDSAAGNNAAQYGYGTMTGTIAMDMIAGIPTYVGNFNAVINGQGFFIVRSNKADITNEDLKSSGCSFTRVGQFTVDNNGYIVDSGNNFVFGFLKEDLDDPDSSYQTDTLKPLRLTDVEGNIIEGDDDEPAIARITFTGLFLGQSIRLPQITLFLLLHVPPFHARICGAYKYGSMHAYGVYVLLLLSVRV